MVDGVVMEGTMVRREGEMTVSEVGKMAQEGEEEDTVMEVVMVEGVLQEEDTVAEVDMVLLQIDMVVVHPRDIMAEVVREEEAGMDITTEVLHRDTVVRLDGTTVPHKGEEIEG